GELKAVTVTTTKPMVEVKADKTILNVEGTINATGNDALELLRKSPGVTVDKDDNISLSGKNGVQVYIDGKPTPLTGTDLANYLKSLQSTQIESIELITNPSAKYEAAGNAGIINIRLKKNKTYGFNGSVNAGWNIGTYAKYNSGIALNYRYKKINVFGSYNYNNNKNQNRLNLYLTNNVNFNANYRFADTSGHELNIDADYGFYDGKNNQYQPNDIYDASGVNLKSKEVYNTLTPYNIDIYSIKADYEQNFKKGKLGYGGKISYVKTDNTFQRFFESNSGLLEDNHNNFNYKENINAGYVNYNRQFKGVMVQAGLRVENTKSKGHSVGFRYDYTSGNNVPIDSLLDRSYTNPFPS